jgi:hypothetical protein
VSGLRHTLPAVASRIRCRSNCWASAFFVNGVASRMGRGCPGRTYSMYQFAVRRERPPGLRSMSCLIW